MVIVFGYSKLGFNILQKISDIKNNIILVEPDPELLKLAKKDNVASFYYDFECYDDEDLIKIGILENQVDSFYCVHNDFNKNLFVTLSVRNLRKDILIISQAGNENDEKKLKLAGASKILNPYDLTGTKIFRHIHRPMSLKIIDNILYGDSELKIKEILILEGSKLAGKDLKESTHFEQYDLIVLGIQDTELSHKFIFASSGINHKIDSGDTLVVIGKNKNIKEFKEYING